MDHDRNNSRKSGKSGNTFLMIDMKITSHFPMSRTAIAKHLNILAEAKLISGHKSGREKIYLLHPEPLAEQNNGSRIMNDSGKTNFPY